MRLLVLTTSFPSQAFQTSGIFVQRLLSELPGHFKICVLLPGCHLPLVFSPLSANFRIRQFQYAPRNWQLLVHSPGGIPVVLKAKPWTWALVPPFGAAMFGSALSYAGKADIIHAHWAFAGIIAGLVGRGIGLPAVTTLRGTDVRWAEKSSAFKKALRLSIKLNSRIVTVGEDLADQVRKLAPADHKKIVVIPNGVDDLLFSVKERSESGHTVTVVGNLIQSKQVDVILHAFASLVGADNRLRLVIVGEGPERNKLKTLAHRLSIVDRVVFKGQLSPDQVVDQLASSSVLVLASRSEGRPNVVLEAMAAGVPVVASDIGGVRELIGNDERGLLFPVGDIERLAACIKHILDNPNLAQRLARRASQWVKEQGLTWERSAQAYAALYQQVIDEYRQRSVKRSCAG